MGLGMKIIDQPREMGEQERADWAVLWGSVESILTGTVKIAGSILILLMIGGLISLAGYCWRLL